MPTISEQPDYQTALQRETKARREAQGWCEHHQIYHRNFTCEHGAGIPLLNVRADLLKKLEGPEVVKALADFLAKGDEDAYMPAYKTRAKAAIAVIIKALQNREVG